MRELIYYVAASIDGFIAHEVGLKDGVTSPYPTLDQYVFSRTLQGSPDEHVTLISEDGAETVRAIKREPGKAVWLCGGAALAGSLFAADLVDGLIKLNPVLFGAGIPLLTEIKTTALELTDSKAYPSGHMLLRYRVKRRH